MSIKSKPYYWVECDFPDCGVSAQEGSDYTAWGDVDTAEETARDADWWTSEGGEQHYCDNHPAVWQSDLEQPEAVTPPPTPYLLLLDVDGDGCSAARLVTS